MRKEFDISRRDERESLFKAPKPRGEKNDREIP